MRKRLLTKTRSELTDIGNLLAQLSQAVLLLAEREEIEWEGKELPKKTGRSIGKRMAKDKKVTEEELLKYALELPVVVSHPTEKKPHRVPRSVYEIEGDLIDVKRDSAKEDE